MKTDAQQYVEKWAVLDGYDNIEKYMDDSYYYYEFIGHGFVFRDGSLLDVTDGTDHRVIPIEDWEKYDILTYHIGSNRELSIRIHNKLHPQQYKAIVDAVELYDFDMIYVDFYKNRELKDSKTIKCFSSCCLRELTEYM